MNISNFFIGMLFIGLFAAVLGLFFGGVADGYGKTYDNTTFSEYDQFSALAAQSEDLNDKLGAVGGDTSATTWTSSFISGGYTVVKTTGQSFGTFNTMADQAMDDANLGSSTSFFKNYLVLIVLFAFIFIWVAVIVGRNTL